MKRLAAAAILAVLYAAPSHASDWREQDTAYQIAYTMVNAADLASTWSVTNGNSGTWEVNPIIGRNPTRARLVGTFLTTAVIHYAVARMIPPRYRTAFYSATIGIKAGMVAHNNGIDDGRDNGWLFVASFRY